MNRSGHPCTWTYSADDYSSWSTTCGRTFCMIDDTPKANDYNFCPGCGGELIEVMPIDPPDEDSTEKGGCAGCDDGREPCVCRSALSEGVKP